MTKLYPLVVCLSFLVGTLQAQISPTDSLGWAFEQAQTDTARLAIALNSSPAFYELNPDKGIAFYQKAQQLAEKIGNKKASATFWYHIGAIYAAFKIDEGTAFTYYQKAATIYEDIKDYKGCEKIYYAMAIVYDHQGFKDKMFEYFLKSFESSEKLPDPHNGAMHALITSYRIAKQTDKAFAIAQRGVRMMEKPDISSYNKMFAYYSMLCVLKMMPNQEKAIADYDRKLKVLLDNEPLPKSSNQLLQVMQIAWDLGRYDWVIKKAQYILTLKDTTQMGLINEAYAHQFLADVYEKQKEYPLSIKHYKAHTDLVARVNAQRATADAGRKIIKVEAERDLALKQSEIYRQRLFSIAGFLMVVLLSIGIVLTYRFYKREQQTKQELAVLNTTKDKLFAFISHDLVSPMANLKNILTLTDWALLSQADFKAVVKDLSLKTNNVYQAFENILHWSLTQMRGIKASVEPVALAEVVAAQVNLLEPIAQLKHISIRQQVPQAFIVTLDKNHLAFIVRNLLQNALKFTPEHGVVTLDCRVVGAQKQLRIQDTGVGMTPEMVEGLFKNTGNTHRKGTNEEGGTGLGLVLVKELAALNKGTITVETALGSGTTFTLSFS